MKPDEVREFKAALDKMMARFEREAKRLHDRSILEEAKSILQFYFKSSEQLGGIEHEIATRAISSELRLVREHSRKSRSQLLKQISNFSQVDPSEGQRLFKQARRSANSVLAQQKDPQIRATVTELKSSMESVKASVAAFDQSSADAERALLVFTAQMHFSIFTRLALQRVISFIGQHGFRFLVPILAFGVFYSSVTREMQSNLNNAIHMKPWGIAALVLLVLPSVFKEYVLSKWTTTWRRRVERRLLIPVLDHATQARLHGVLRDSMERQPAKS